MLIKVVNNGFPEQIGGAIHVLTSREVPLHLRPSTEDVGIHSEGYLVLEIQDDPKAGKYKVITDGTSQTGDVILTVPKVDWVGLTLVTDGMTVTTQS